MKKNFKEIALIILSVALFISVWVLGFIQGTNWGWQVNLPSPFEKVINKEAPPAVPASDMSVFWESWKVVLEKYVDRQNLDPQKMIIGATKGLINSLGDPYSEFLTTEQTQELSEELSGEFSGVGMEIAKKDGYLVVVSPLPNTPAERAGLKPNDIILMIEDTETMNLSATEASQLIRGEPGTTVKLTIYRSTWNEAKTIELKREKILIPSVSWEKLENNIAYLKIYNFNLPVTIDFYKVALEISLAKPDGLILDLRNNPGGYLDSVVDISGWFLSNGDIVLKEDFGNGEIKVFRVSLKQSLLKNIPTVVLVNEGTASASEILAGALRDNRGVKLIGTKTFGKGSVQELISLKDNNSLKLTISRWLTPNGTIIQDNGLEPDIKVENEEDFGAYAKIDLERDKQLLTAISELTKLMK
ncbi:MAG: S41 family peptidase [Candidatus Pacebacteria bacterium]|nr:S41 family peptidase [Candidatus Paceibacterota bacterium]